MLAEGIRINVLQVLSQGNIDGRLLLSNGACAWSRHDTIWPDIHIVACWLTAHMAAISANSTGL